MRGHDDYIDDGLDFDNDDSATYPLDGRAKPSAPRDEASSELDAESPRLKIDAARRAWSFAVMAALGYLALTCAAILAFSAALPNAASILRAILALTIVAAPLAIATRARESDPRARLFFAISQLSFGPALAFGATDASLTLGSEKFWSAFGDALLAALGAWTFAALFFACVLRTRGVCYITGALALFWETTSDSRFATIAAMFVCAAGVFRAWRLSSRSVATLFGALCFWTILSGRETWSALTASAPTLGIVAFFLYWYGAAYKNAALRGVGLFAGGIALGWASIPAYWDAAFWEDAPEWLPRVLQCASTLLFVGFCGHMLLSGAQRSAWRFCLGAFLATSWTIYMATLAWGTLGPLSSCLLLGVAGLTFGLIFKVEGFLSRRGTRFSEKARNLKAPTTDALSDALEFHDFVEAELEATRGTPPSATETACRLALADFWERTRRKALALGAGAELVAILVGSLLYRIS
ncbi:MAG: hypothetical protein ACI4NV_05200 [Thermoguttaceae bacterium]